VVIGGRGAQRALSPPARGSGGTQLVSSGVRPRPQMHFGRIESPENASSGSGCHFVVVNRLVLNHMRNFQAAEKGLGLEKVLRISRLLLHITKVF